MRTKIEWAELHSPLFLNGTNLGQKLDPHHGKHKGQIHLEFDEDNCHLYVTHTVPNGPTKTARVPDTSVLSMVEAKLTPDAVKAVPKPVEPMPTVEAQAETPQSHVFGGPGKGQTGRGGKVKA